MTRGMTERVAAVRRELSALDSTRRQANATLDRVLQALEARFSARTVERDEIGARLVPLAQANHTLATLCSRLVGIAERSAAADHETTARLADAMGALSGAADWRFEDVSDEELMREDQAASS